MSQIKRVLILAALLLGMGCTQSQGQLENYSPLTESSCTVGESANSQTKIYYVAVNEPGADNDNCDGLSPKNEGNGRCPFKDFTSTLTKHLLVDAKNTRVEVRAGTYSTGTTNAERLTVQGTGTNDAERAVLTAYKDEAVIFDGGNIQREIVHVSGTYSTVEKITFRNAGAHNVVVNAGEQHRVQCNKFLRNLGSDSTKGSPGAGSTLVRHNEFTEWDSAAIDITGVNDWIIENNYFHDSRAPRGQPVGAKMGSKNVIIRKNIIRNTAGLDFGGVASLNNKPHPSEYEAINIIAENNTFENIRESKGVVRFYSCLDCKFTNNLIRGATAGFVLQATNFNEATPSTCLNDTIDCRPSKGAIVGQNKFKNINGGSSGYFNVFGFANASETSGFSAFENIYCILPSGPEIFAHENQFLSFSGWKAVVNTDVNSAIVSDSDLRCGF